MAGHENNIKIHQTLHGYAEGHRLLESSIKLPSSAARVALLISDMSGPSMFPGFESYITGYPLPDVNMYALGRTWYAPEMSRPGCVWTHTLLIDNADLAQIPDLLALLELFVRPSKEKTWSSFKNPIEIPMESRDDNVTTCSWDFEGIVPQVLKGIYDNSDNPVYLPSNTAERYENLLIAIWTQQWPRLRRSFRFCTGSLSNRKLDGKPFDLQVIPHSLLGQIQRDVDYGVIIKQTSNSLSHSFPDDTSLNTSSLWLKVATDDLMSESSAPVRRFLWRFGADLTEGRSAFASLTQTYIYISEVKSYKRKVADLLEFVSNKFPLSNQAVRLKQTLFGEPTNKTHLLRGINEIDILRELVTTEYHSAFKPSSLSIQERAKALLESNHGEAIELTLQVISSEITPLGEEFLTGVCKSISIDDALYLSQKKPGLLPLIIQHNPGLITEPSLWRRSVDIQRELFDTVMRQTNIGEDFLYTVIPLLLDSGSDALAEDIVSHIGARPTVITILEWFDSKHSKDIPSLGEKWKRILSWNKGQLLEWLTKKDPSSIQVTTLALIASILDPHAYQTIDAGAQIWLPLAERGAEELEYNSCTTSMSFLLALGFHNPRPSGVELVTQAFEVVHTAAEHNRLNYSNWGLLQNQAPAMSFWRGWDWCERLRCALIEHFIRFKWPYDQFFRATARPETFARVLDCCDMTSQGRKFFRKLKQHAAKDFIEVTDQQRRVLEKYK